MLPCPFSFICDFSVYLNLNLSVFIFKFLGNLNYSVSQFVNFILLRFVNFRNALVFFFPFGEGALSTHWRPASVTARGYGGVLAVVASSPEIAMHQRNRYNGNTAESRLTYYMPDTVLHPNVENMNKKPNNNKKIIIKP